MKGPPLPRRAAAGAAAVAARANKQTSAIFSVLLMVFYSSNSYTSADPHSAYPITWKYDG